MARKLKVDFTDVESYIKCAEGEHIATLREVEEKQSSTGNDMLSVKFEVVKGSSTGATLFDNFVLTEKALWKLKGYLEVVGLKADGKIAIDLDKLIGKTCIISVGYEEYNGNEVARINSYKKIEVKPAEDDDDDDYDDDDDDDEPVETPKEKKARLAKEKAEADALAAKKAAAAAKKGTPPAAETKKEKAARLAKEAAAAAEDDDDDEWDEAE